MQDVKVCLIGTGNKINKLLIDDILIPAGYKVSILSVPLKAEHPQALHDYDVIFVEDEEHSEHVLQFVEEYLGRCPSSAIIILASIEHDDKRRRAFHLGVVDYLTLPFNTKDVLAAVEAGVKRRDRLQTWAENQNHRNTDTVWGYSKGINNLEEIGRSITASLDCHKLNAILTQIEDGLIVIGTDRRIVLINRVARDILRIKEDGWLGKPVNEVIRHDELLDILISVHDELPYRREITYEEGYILSTQFVRIPDVGFALTLQDVSYYKELDRIKTEFVQTVSHDLRSPLTAILGYVELLNKVGEVNEQQQEFINRVQISVRNITELINNLLELGRIESGYDTLKEYVLLGVIAQYAIDGVRKHLNDRQQKLTIDICRDIPYTIGDPVRLKKMFDILLINAVQFTPNQGHISLHLTTEKDQIILQVKDDGIGIPLQDQPYIFEKFYRASNRPDDVSGSGLGLAIVKSIVENHYGRVWVDSKVGVGSCFTVMLPISEMDQTSA